MKPSTYIWGFFLGLIIIAVRHEVKIRDLEDERVRVDRAFRYITELRVELDKLKPTTNLMDRP